MRDFELEIVRFLREHATPLFDRLSEAITFLGEEYALILILALVYFVFNKRLGEKIAFAIFASISLNNSLKGVIKLPRPFEVDPTIDAVRIETATGYSFPSGHSQNAGVTYFSLGLTFKKRWFFVICVIIITLIGLSRMTLGVHFPSDVIFGIALGIGMAILCSKLYDRYANTLKSKMKLYLLFLAIYTPFLLIFAFPSEGNADKYRDFYISYSLFAGFILAMYIENKYVGFDCDIPMSKRLLRFAIGMIVVLFIQSGLKILLPTNIMFDMIRYFSVSFIGLGLYPFLARKWLFPSVQTDIKKAD